MLLKRIENSISKLHQHVRSSLSDVYFVTTPVTPTNVVSPLAAINDRLSGLRDVRLQTPVTRQTAQTACEMAKNACKHVDIAAKTNTTSGWPTMPNQSYPYYRPPAYQPSPPPEFWAAMMDFQKQLNAGS